MAIITEISGDWSAAITLTKREAWQCQYGAVRIATGAAAPVSEGDGLSLAPGDVVEFADGMKIYYRLSGPTAAKLTRTELEP